MSWLVVLIAWLLGGMLLMGYALAVAARSHVHFEKNPIAWIPFALACVAALPVLVLLPVLLLVAALILGPLQWLGFRRFIKEGHRARFADDVIEIYNRENSAERTIPWTDVERAETLFEPPVTFPVLILRDTTRVPLHLVDSEELAIQLEERSIPFDRRYGSTGEIAPFSMDE